MQKFDTWREACSSDHALYEDTLKTRPIEARIAYANARSNESQKFVKTLAATLGKGSTVLDLGSSGVPWFSYLCSDCGLKVISYDFQKPVQPDILHNKGITYIQDDINNIHSYSNALKGVDFIFCRGFSPAQKLVDWYDRDFCDLGVLALNTFAQRHNPLDTDEQRLCSRGFSTPSFCKSPGTIF